MDIQSFVTEYTSMEPVGKSLDSELDEEAGLTTILALFAYEGRLKVVDESTSDKNSIDQYVARFRLGLSWLTRDQ